jgi:MSHA type pilus biogenesis protein MshL
MAGGGAMGGSGGGGGGSVGGNVSGSSMNLRLDNSIEFWKELEEQVKKLLTETGRTNTAINMTAGVIQVTDRPSALKRVENYLGQLTQSVSRQVDIEAKIYDVTLNDQFQFGIDWQRIVESGGGQLMFGGLPTITAPSGAFSLQKESLAVSFTDSKTSVILKALQEQGSVSVVSQPRLRTLNNQTAIMKVGRDEPFFTQVSQVVASAGAEVSQTGDILSVITVGTVLSITPQISTNGWISLDISPAITSLVDTITSPSGNSSAPVLDIKQTSTIVRVRDGQTIVIGGLIQNSSARSLRKIPLIAEVPLLGKLFQGRFDAKEKKELVIFLTPTIVPSS